MTFWKDPAAELLTLLSDIDAGSKLCSFDTDEHIYCATFGTEDIEIDSKEFWEWYLEPVMDQISRSIREIVPDGGEALFFAPESSDKDNDPLLVVVYEGRVPFTLTILKEKCWMSKGGCLITRNTEGATEVSGLTLLVETMMEEIG